MKIAICSDYYSKKGGIRSHIDSISQCLRSRGHDVKIITGAAVEPNSELRSNEALEAGEDGEGAPDRRVHSWSLWSLTRSLPSRKGTSRKHPYQSPETIGVESSGTIGSTERSPGEGDSPGGKTASPGNGPPAREAAA